jgi:hypothetical protein
MAVNREQVIRYATPLVRADSEKRAWLVVSGQIQGSASGLDGTSLYLFKEGLPQIVEGDEAGQRLKSLLSERR